MRAGTDLVKSLALPVFLCVLVEVLDVYVDEGSILSFLALPLIYCYLYVLIAVRTHRVVIIDPRLSQKRAHLVWSARHFKFFAFACYYFVLVMVAVFLVGIIVGTETVFFSWEFQFFMGVLVALAFSLIVARISLIFPAAAVDETLSVVGSFKLTQGHNCLAFMVVILMPVIVWLIFDIVLWPFERISNDFVYALVSSIIYIPLLVFEITILSRFYVFVLERAHVK